MRSRASSGGRTTSGSTLAFLLALVVGLAVLEFYARHFWFFGDEFAFLFTHRISDLNGPHAVLDQLFRPHNEHPSLLPQLWYWLADSLWGLRTYWPYATAAIVVHLGVCTMVWRLMLVVGVARWIAFGFGCLLIFFGPGWENIFWGFQVGFMGSVFFGLAAILVANHAGGHWRRDVSAVALGIAAVSCSGVGVSMCVGLAVVLILRRGFRGLLLAAIPLAVFAVWARSFPPEQNGIPHAHSADVFAYALAQLSASLQAIVGVPGVAGVMLVVVAAFVGWRWRGGLDTAPLVPALAALVASVTLALATGFGRASLGIEQASSSRYLYLQAALLIPLVALALSQLPTGGQARRGIALVLIPLSLVSAVMVMRIGVRDRSALVLEVRDQVLNVAADPALMSILPSSTQVNAQFAPDITVGKLADLVRSGKVIPNDPAPSVIDGTRRLLVARPLAEPSGGWRFGSRPTILSSSETTISRDGRACWKVNPLEAGATVTLANPIGRVLLFSRVGSDFDAPNVTVMAPGFRLELGFQQDGAALAGLRSARAEVELGNTPVRVCSSEQS